MTIEPKAAMVLAAGLGRRMRPITDRMPKPLVAIAGRTLLDRGLDSLAAAGVETAVVNVHHFPEQIVAHVASRTAPKVVISDESGRLLDSAGAIVKALPLLGGEPFYILNADTFWIDHGEHNLTRLARRWDGSRMDMLLMLAEPRFATGHGGGSDFLLGPAGTLSRSGGAAAGLIYAGAGLVDPGIFRDAPAGPLSLNRYFDGAIAGGRLFGLIMDGNWITVGSPESIPLAEAALARLAGAR